MADRRYIEAVVIPIDPFGWVDPVGGFHPTSDHLGWIKEYRGFDPSSDESGALDAYDDAMTTGWVRVSPNYIEVGHEPSDQMFRYLQDLFSNHPAHIPIVIENHELPTDSDWFSVKASELQIAKHWGALKREGVKETVYRSELRTILEDAGPGASDRAEEPEVQPEIQSGMLAQDKEILARLKTDEYPATADEGDAFVFHWADGRGACAFKHKKDAIAWIEDDVNHEGSGPEIIGFWLDEPYCPKTSRKKGHRLRIANSYTKTKPRKKSKRTSTRVSEAVDRDAEASQMLSRYQEEPTNIWMYSNMPMKDRVAWSYLAADLFKTVDSDSDDLVARFMETLREVVEDPETFWQQIREKDPTRAAYLDKQDWGIEMVPLEDAGVYPRFSGFSDEICRSNVLDTAVAIENTDEQPHKVQKLHEMAETWTTILKFLPPILVSGGTLRGRKEDYEQTQWDIDDGNHRLVAAAMAGATEAVCFVGKAIESKQSESSDRRFRAVEQEEPIWTREGAEAWIAERHEEFDEAGFTPEIVGSVATKGQSSNDFDIALHQMPGDRPISMERAISRAMTLCRRLGNEVCAPPTPSVDKLWFIWSRLPDGRVVELYLDENEFPIEESVTEGSGLSYLEIGHQGGGQAWFLPVGAEDLVVGEIGIPHHEIEGYNGRYDAAGRIDHDRKLVSVASNTIGKEQYVAKLLRMDYPDYQIVGLRESAASADRRYIPMLEAYDWDNVEPRPHNAWILPDGSLLPCSYHHWGVKEWYQENVSKDLPEGGRPEAEAEATWWNDYGLDHGWLRVKGGPEPIDGFSGIEMRQKPTHKQWSVMRKYIEDSGVAEDYETFIDFGPKTYETRAGILYKSSSLEAAIRQSRLFESVTEGRVNIEKHARAVLAKFPQDSPGLWYHPKERHIWISRGDGETTEDGYADGDELKAAFAALPGVDKVTLEYEAGPEVYWKEIKLRDHKMEESLVTDEWYQVTEQVGHGEWWVDESGRAEFADGDIGDTNHAWTAFTSMIEMSPDDDPNAPEMIPMEPLSEEAVNYLRENDVNEQVITFLEQGGDPREWAIQHSGWIRVAGTSAELWKWDDASLSTLKEGLFDAWQLDDPDEEDLDIEVNIEEASTRRVLAVPLKALMDDRYDAASLERLGATGEVTPATSSDFTSAAWARKAAGERGVDEAAGKYTAADVYAQTLVDFMDAKRIEVPESKTPGVFVEVATQPLMRWLGASKQSPRAGKWEISPVGTGSSLWDEAVAFLRVKNNEVKLYIEGVGKPGQTVPVDINVDWYQEPALMRPVSRVKIMNRSQAESTDRRYNSSITERIDGLPKEITSPDMGTEGVLQKHGWNLTEEDVIVEDKEPFASFYQIWENGSGKRTIKLHWMNQTIRPPSERDVEGEYRTWIEAQAMLGDRLTGIMELHSSKDLPLFEQRVAMLDESVVEAEGEGELTPEQEKVIIEFVKTHPNLFDDDDFHAFAKSIGADPHEAEEVVYRHVQQNESHTVDRRFIEATFQQDSSFQNISSLLSDNEKYALSVIARGAEHYDINDQEAFYNRLDRLAPEKVPFEDRTDEARRSLDTLESYSLIRWDEEPKGSAVIWWAKLGPEYADFEEILPNGLPAGDSSTTIDRAITLFGLTNDPMESGFILPDGRMLDFSGKREDRSAAGKRHMDHSEVNRVSGVSNLHDFCNQTGAIRMNLQPHTVNFQLHSNPTNQQRRVMQQMLQSTGYSGEIDMIANGRVAHYQEISNKVDAGHALSKASSIFESHTVDRRFIEAREPIIRGFIKQKEGNLDRIKVEYENGEVWHYYVPTGIYETIRMWKNKHAIAGQLKAKAERSYLEQDEDFSGNEKVQGKPRFLTYDDLEKFGQKFLTAEELDSFMNRTKHLVHDRRYLAEAVPGGMPNEYVKPITDWVMSVIDEYAISPPSLGAFGNRLYMSGPPGPVFTTHTIGGKPFTFSVAMNPDTLYGDEWATSVFGTAAFDPNKTTDSALGPYKTSAVIGLDTRINPTEWRDVRKKQAARSDLRKHIKVALDHELGHLQRMYAEGSSGWTKPGTSTMRDRPAPYSRYGKDPGVKHKKGPAGRGRTPWESDPQFAELVAAWKRMTSAQRAKIDTFHKLTSKVYGPRKASLRIITFGEYSQKQRNQTLSRLNREGIPIRKWGSSIPKDQEAITKHRDRELAIRKKPRGFDRRFASRGA